MQTSLFTGLYGLFNFHQAQKTMNSRGFEVYKNISANLEAVKCYESPV